jgi:periplasmic protein TonB
MPAMLKDPPTPELVSRIQGALPLKAEGRDPYRNPRFASVRKGRLVGFAVTVTLEFLIAWLGNRTHYVPPPVVRSDEVRLQIVLPKLEPDPVDDIVEQSSQAADQAELAPPMQTDVPQAITPESFVQQIEPPPPDFSELAKNVVKIPENRTNFGKITVLDISELDRVPIPRFRARPLYPSDMIAAGLSGNVLVDFIVDTEGNVRNAFAVHSSHIEFESNAVSAVQRWKFTPGRKNNHAVYVHMQVPIIFNLRKLLEDE